MNGESLWNKIMEELVKGSLEVKTRTGLWVKAYLKNNSLYIEKAIDNAPSSKINKSRNISKKDFLTVYSYYDRWIDQEKGIRHEVTSLSQNTAYIFALISHFK